MKPEVDIDGTMSGFLVESVTSQLILKSQQVDVVSQGHFSHAVRVEVKLVLDDFRKVLRNSNKNILDDGSFKLSKPLLTFFCNMQRPRGDKTLTYSNNPWLSQLES